MQKKTSQDEIFSVSLVGMLWLAIASLPAIILQDNGYTSFESSIYGIAMVPMIALGILILGIVGTYMIDGCVFVWERVAQ